MKAVSPTIRNKLIFATLFNILMVFIYYFATGVELTFKFLAATNLIVVFFWLNWLPKSAAEMDEREKAEWTRVESYMHTITVASFTLTFMAYLIWFQSMTVTYFMVIAGSAIMLAQSILSYSYRKNFFSN